MADYNIVSYTGSNDVRIEKNLVSFDTAYKQRSKNKEIKNQNIERDKTIYTALNAAINEGTKNGWYCNFVPSTSILYSNEIGGEDTISLIANALKKKGEYGWSLCVDYEYKLDEHGFVTNLNRVVLGGIIFWGNKKYDSDSKKYVSLKNYPSNTYVSNDGKTYSKKSYVMERWYEILRDDLISTSKIKIDGKDVYKGLIPRLGKEISELKETYDKITGTTESDKTAKKTAIDAAKATKEKLDDAIAFLKTLNRERLGSYPSRIKIDNKK